MHRGSESSEVELGSSSRTRLSVTGTSRSRGSNCSEGGLALLPGQASQTRQIHPRNSRIDTWEGHVNELDLGLATEHGLNSRVKRVPVGAKPCPCGRCTYKADGRQYSLFCHPTELSALGPGWVLFFDFTKFITLLLLFYQVMYISVAGYNFSIEGAQQRLECGTFLSNDLNLTDVRISACAAALSKALEESETSVSIPAYWMTAGNWGLSTNLVGGKKAICDKASSSYSDIPVETTMKFPWVIFNHYICLAGTVGFVLWYRTRQVNLALLSADKCVTARDYSVLLEGLPNYCRSELAVINWVNMTLDLPAFDDDGQRPIVRAVLCFDMSKIAQDVTQWSGLKTELHGRVAAARRLRRFAADAGLQAELMSLRKRMHGACEKVVAAIAGQLDTSAAIVVFRHEEDAARLLEKLRVRFSRWTWICRLLLPRCCAKWILDRGVGSFGDDGHIITASYPPRPSDVRWESFGGKLITTVFRQIVGLILSVFILALSTYAMLAFTKHAKDPTKILCMATDKMEEMDNAFAAKAIEHWESMNTALVSSCTLFVQALNFIYPYMAEWLAHLKKPLTQTELRTGEMWRITIFTVLNTVFVQFFVHAQFTDVVRSGCTGHLTTLLAPCKPDEPCFTELSLGICADWYSSGHLVEDMVYTLAFGCVLAPLLVAFPPMYFYGLVQRLYYRSKDLQHARISQDELNQIFEGPEAALPYRYAHLLNMLVMAITFMPIMPLMPVFCAAGLLLYYLANKYFLLRVAKTPYVQDRHISFRALELVLLTVLPQPMMMGWLLSPNVEHWEWMWGTIGVAKLFLLPAVIAVYFACKMVNRRLRRNRRPAVLCEHGHKMTQMDAEDFQRRCKNVGESRCCQRCDEELQEEEDTEDFKYPYQCLDCQELGRDYDLCASCCQNMRKERMLKRADLPYEQAKRYFRNQYWTFNPLYRLFEDYFAWQEKDEDKATQFAETWELAWRNSDPPELADCVVKQVEANGLEVTDLEGVHCYTRELVKKHVVINGEDELEVLLSAIDEDYLVTKTVIVGSCRVAPGWEICGELPTAEEMCSEQPIVLELWRDYLTLAQAMVELSGEPWCAISSLGLPSKGPSALGKRNTMVCCDWSQLFQDKKFRVMFDSQICPRCTRNFASQEELLLHYQRTNHDV